MLRYRCIVLFFLMLGSQMLLAQRFQFSYEKDSFAVDVVRSLRSVGLEATNKVAFDFKNTWDTQMTDEQKTGIMDICKKMDARRLANRPYYRYFFSLITYALTQENANEEEFSNLLKIVNHAVDNYDKKSLVSTFKTLTFFFARGFIYYSHYNKLTSDGGSYRLELIEIEEPIPAEPEEESEDPFVPIDAEKELREVDEYVTADELEGQFMEDAGWGDDDGWSSSDDDWGSDDGWGDDSSDDGWGSEEYGFLPDPDEEEEEKGFVRPVVEMASADLVAQLQSNDQDPPIEGAVIHMEDMEFKMSTPYDTIRIKNASGTLLLKDQIFVGTGGVFDWPDEYRGTDGALVDLNQYSFNIRGARISTSRAKMVFPEMFEDSVAGAFEFRSGRRYRGQKRSTPKFISLHSDIDLNLPGDSLFYNGGFGLIAGQKYGMSISEIPSVLEVYGKDDRRFRAKAKKYTFEDSLIRSERAQVSIFHEQDSIYHPAVRLKYEAGLPKLSLFKEDGDFKNTYYYSSFFRMEFKTDMLEWDMSSDSLDVSILNASNIVPAVFESEEYYNQIRYEKMSGLFGFHPIIAVVQYARKAQDSNFNLLELVSAYDIDPKRLHAAVIFLHQNGYITFDEETEQIQVLRKAFHYIMASNKMKDYDNFLVSSVSPSKPNASLNFKTKQMDVRGVKRVYITPDQEVYFEPDSMLLTLLEDKAMKFSGMVNAEDFQYRGHDFIFNYQQYLVEMEAIDSIRIQIAFDEEVTADGEKKRTSLHQHLEATSGTLYINDPKNKAGLKNYVQYPYFVSESEAIVYFDSPDVLDGAYDKSIYFVVPPFKTDTVGQGDPTALGFEGTFYSGGILPPIQETLEIMPDRSMGFVHDIPDEGYNLYEGGGTLYDTLYMNFDGLQGNGKIDYRTARVNSDQFTFYMDSVTAEGVQGHMNEGTIGEATYPEANLADFKMKWLPLKDSMYIENREAPFEFYGATASLDGKANITAKGVYGSGIMLSRGSKSRSQDFHFEIDRYSGRHSEFEILTDNPEKPAMSGEDLFFEFDLDKNVAEVRPEVAGEASIGFPYAQMKTSITEAIWYLDSSKIAMNKPDNVDISYSYFYTTREDLDSLAFNASRAVYDMDTYELDIEGIPFIKVADAEIVPVGGQTTILENSVLQPFENVDIYIDTLNQYHHLYDGYITVISRKQFEGHATYEMINSVQDTFAIEFESFELKDVVKPDGSTKTMTVTGGFITEGQNVRTSPGFYFKGDVTMFADQRELLKQGYITLDSKSLGRYDYWIEYDSQGDTTDIFLDIKSSQTEDAQPVVAGLLQSNMTNDIYMSLVNNKNLPEDNYFFEAEGLLSYDAKKGDFKIEHPDRTFNEGYAGKSLVYNDYTEKVLFEGKVNFIENKPQYNIEAAVVGSGVPDSSQYRMDAMMLFSMALETEEVEDMIADVVNTIELVGAEVAHGNEIELMIKLAQFVGDDIAKDYEQSMLGDYRPLLKTSPIMERTIAISNVDLQWSDSHNAWYSTSKIGLSHIAGKDINALCDGFLEMKKSDEGEDIVHLFLQMAPSTWYFFSYEHGRLLLYSANPDFNNMVAENSNITKAGFGEYTTVLGDEFEVLKFVNDFRLTYFGIGDDYNLEFPDDTHIQEEVDIYEEESTEEEEGAVDTAEPLGEHEDDGF